MIEISSAAYVTYMICISRFCVVLFYFFIFLFNFINLLAQNYREWQKAEKVVWNVIGLPVEETDDISFRLSKNKSW